MKKASMSKTIYLEKIGQVYQVCHLFVICNLSKSLVIFSNFCNLSKSSLFIFDF